MRRVLRRDEPIQTAPVLHAVDGLEVVLDAGLGEQDVRHFADSGLRTIEGGAIRQLHDSNPVILVLCGDEAERGPGQAKPRQPAETKVKRAANCADAQEAANHAGVGGGGALNEPVESAEEAGGPESTAYVTQPETHRSVTPSPPPPPPPPEEEPEEVKEEPKPEEEKPKEEPKPAEVEKARERAKNASPTEVAIR